MSAQICGYLGNILMSLQAIPQLYKIILSKSSKDLSYGSLAINFIGSVFCLIYGVKIHESPIIISVIISSTINTATFCVKVYLEKFKIEPIKLYNIIHEQELNV